MKIRRQFTPPEIPGAPSGDAKGVHATRRGAARHELNNRVVLRPLRASGSASGAASGDASGGPAAVGEHLPVLEGWALNVSRGGLRLILEERVQLGAEFDVTFRDGTGPTDAAGAPVIATPCPGRVVWVQEEPDGVVVGIEFRRGGIASS